MRELFILGSFFVIVPIILGCSFRSEHNISLTFAWPMGFLMECALFETLCIPMTIIGGTFTALIKLFSGVLLGILCLIIYYKKKVIYALFNRKIWKSKYICFGGVILVGIIIIQTYIPTMMTDYGSWDDSSYIVTALDTIKTNTLWRTSPYNGEYMLMPSKRILTSWSIYNAFLAYVSGVAPATLSHFVEPIVMIPMTYNVVIEMARNFFDRKERQIEFAIIVGILLMFGFRANSAMEHWILMWPWSGRSIFFGIVIPFTISYIMETLKQGLNMNKAWGIVILNIAACSFTTMSIGMMTILMIVILISYNISIRRWFTMGEIKGGLLALSPQIIFLIIYIAWRGNNGYS